MKLRVHFQEALTNLFSSKLRSALALLGVLVGTASVVAMVSGGEMATSEALKQFKTLGTDLLSVSMTEAAEKQSSAENQSSLTLAQAEEVVTADKNILNAAPYIQLYSPAQFNEQELNANILGVTPAIQDIVHINLARGRFISPVDGYAFVCIIGNALYQTIKQHTFLDPLGQQLQLGKNYFTIVGIAAPWPENSFVYANIDNAILVPLLTTTILSKYAAINNIIMRLSPHANIDEVKNNINFYLNQKLANKRIFFRSAKELIARMEKQNQILTIFLGLIGSVSLLVGGIGVMNIMLVSVVERRREIGIRLAVGARRSDIRTLFLAESVMLSLVGGLLGVMIGIIISWLIAYFSHWQFHLFLLPPLIGFTVSVAVGVFFGFYPAHRAAQLDPIEALRSV